MATENMSTADNVMRELGLMGENNMGASDVVIPIAKDSIDIEVPDEPAVVEEPKAEKKVKSIEEKAAEVESKATKQISKEVKTSQTKQSNVDYETTVTLPSKGLIYDGKIPASISMRGMTTKDEKVLYASQGSNVFQKLLKSCITDPKDLDISKLIASDELYLVLQLRMITYGPEYKVDATCPICGKQNTYTIMLNDLTVNYLDDDFKEPIMVTLPKSGDTLALRILRNEDSEFVDRFSKKFAKQFGQDVRGVEFESRLAMYIKEVNGTPIDFETARDYVQNMFSRDSAEIRSAMQRILVGVDTTCVVDCVSCGEEFAFGMPLTSEFFRPTFD